MGFFFLLLATGTIFLRPAEIIPALLALPIYNALLLTCLACSISELLNASSTRSLVHQPVGLCAVGMLAAVAVSHLGHSELRYAWEASFDFAKTLIYYLLLIGLVNSPARLSRFLGVLLGLITLATALSLLNYLDIVELHGVEHLEREEVNAATGEVYHVRQLQGTGIFADPNDLCLILVTGMGLSLYKMGDRRAGMFRFAWLLPLALLGYVLTLTYSRGGFIALIVGMLALFHARFGLKKTIPLCLVALPVIFVLFGGRQTNLDSSSGSGQARIQLWLEGIQVFRQEPLTGVGKGLVSEAIGQETHNSFIHCYPDIGFFGGTFFVGMYYYAFEALGRLGRDPARIRDPELRRLRPYLMSIIAGYSAGMLTISRCYIATTYLIPGLAMVFARLATADRPTPLQRFDPIRLVVASLICLAVVFVYASISVRWG
jgi:hypothetical protein